MRLIRYIKRDKSKSENKLKALVAKPDFQTQVKFIRHKWKIKPQKNYKVLGVLLMDEEFNNDVDQLLRTCNLNILWRDFVDRYLVSNVIENEYDPAGAIIEQGIMDDMDPTTGEPIFAIRIYPSTTQDDVKNAYKVIKEKLREDPKKRDRYSPYLERDEYAYSLALDGLNIIQISKALKEKNYGVELKYDHIRKLISRYQKRMNIPKEYRIKDLKLGADTLRSR